MLDAGGGGGGWGSGPTNFEEYSHEALKGMIDGARPAELTASGKALLDAKETLETLTTALETRISRLEWTGKSAESFREWTGKVMVATRKFAEHSGRVGTAMDHAGSELSFALLTMPEVPANAKMIVESNGEKRLVCQPGDTPDKKAMVASAKTELEKARQEAIRRMESLSSTYTVTTETLTKPPAIDFPPLPALPTVSHGGGGGTSNGPRRTSNHSTVKTTVGKDGGTLIPGHGPSGNGGDNLIDGSNGSGVVGSVGGGIDGGGYVPPKDTGLLGQEPFRNGPATLPDPGPTAPGPIGTPPGGGNPQGQPPGLPMFPGGKTGGFPPGGKTGGFPPGKSGSSKAQLTSNPPANGRGPNMTSNAEGLTGGRPTGRGSIGGGAGHNNPGGGAGPRGAGGGRRFTGQSGGVVGGTPRAAGAGQFSSGGSGLAGRGAAGMRGGGGTGTDGGHDQRNRRQRADYLHEEEETWVGDRTTAPPVVD
ncbi:WXG100 family type VII secretion target [Embleya sp. NPDC050493]|uniref:WXG100 family type VII secretion target n=1 Tax=Embleya sp. NPDC050493 TaxID=3363989 RepID=UPI0037ADAB2E